MNRLTNKQATESARAFVRRYADGPALQWDTSTMDRFLPDGWEIRISADYCDRLTIAAVTAFFKAEAVRKEDAFVARGRISKDSHLAMLDAQNDYFDRMAAADQADDDRR